VEFVIVQAIGELVTANLHCYVSYSM